MLFDLSRRIVDLIWRFVWLSPTPADHTVPAPSPAPFLSPCAAHALRSPPSGHRRSPAGPPDTPDGVPDDRRMSDCLSLAGFRLPFGPASLPQVHPIVGPREAWPTRNPCSRPCAVCNRSGVGRARWCVLSLGRGCAEGNLRC